jgi:hypothetical protein
LYKHRPDKPGPTLTAKTKKERFNLKLRNSQRHPSTALGADTENSRFLELQILIFLPKGTKIKTYKLIITYHNFPQPGKQSAE